MSVAHRELALCIVACVALFPPLDLHIHSGDDRERVPGAGIYDSVSPISNVQVPRLQR